MFTSRSFLVAAACLVGTQILGQPAERAAVYKGKPLAAWASLFADGDAKQRAEAGGAFRAFGKPAVPHLIDAVTHSKAAVRKDAASALFQLGEIAEAAIPTLIMRLQDPDKEVRLAVARALGEVGRRHAAQIVPPLIDLLTDADEDLRERAMLALLEQGPAAKAALPFFLRDAKAGKVRVLEEIGRLGPAAVTALARLSEDRDADVRQRAVYALCYARSKAAISPIARALRDANEDVRLHAVAALRRVGEDHSLKAAEPALAAALDDANETVSTEAARLLAGLGPVALPRLKKELAQPAPARRVAALYALGEMEPLTRESADLMLEALKDSDLEVQRAALSTLTRLNLFSITKKHVQVLATLVAANPMHPLRDLAIGELGRLGRDADNAVPLLCSIVADPKDPDRREAAAALAAIGNKACVPVLRDMLKHRKFRRDAAHALAALQAEPKLVVPFLVKDLNNKENVYKFRAIHGLETMGAAAAPAAAALAKVWVRNETDFPQRFVVNRARAALKIIGTHAHGAVPVLKQALKTGDMRQRLEAVEILKCLGPAADPALPALRDCLRNANLIVRVEAAATLWHLERKSDAVLPVLIAALKVPRDLYADDWETRARKKAAKALGDMGKAAESAVSALIAALREDKDPLPAGAALLRVGKQGWPTILSLLKDKEPVNRAFAATLFEGLGPEGKDAAEAIMPLLKDADVRVRLHSARALWAIMGKKEVVLPVLEKALQVDDEEVRRDAADALGGMGRAAAPAVPALLAALKKERPDGDWITVAALGKIGRAARSAVPALIPLLQHENRMARVAASEALKQIDPEAASKAGVW